MNAPVPPFTILLAEDEPADAHLVKTALKENHLLVDLRIVEDGREALEYLRHQDSRFADAPRPDLILLDLNMPRMDGRECLAELKRDQNLCGIPVVILTTSDMERDVMSSYSLGAAGYITKPVDVLSFMAIINSLGEYWFALVRLPANGKSSASGSLNSEE